MADKTSTRRRLNVIRLQGCSVKDQHHLRQYGRISAGVDEEDVLTTAKALLQLGGLGTGTQDPSTLTTPSPLLEERAPQWTFQTEPPIISKIPGPDPETTFTNESITTEPTRTWASSSTTPSGSDDPSLFPSRTSARSTSPTVTDSQSSTPSSIPASTGRTSSTSKAVSSVTRTEPTSEENSTAVLPTLTEQTTSSETSTSAAPLKTGTQDEGEGNNGGVSVTNGGTAGIAIGSMIALILLLLILYLIYRRYQKRKERRNAESVNFAPVPAPYWSPPGSPPPRPLSMQIPPWQVPVPTYDLAAWLAYHGAGNPPPGNSPPPTGIPPQGEQVELRSFTRQPAGAARMYDVGNSGAPDASGSRPT